MFKLIGAILNPTNFIFIVLIIGSVFAFRKKSVGSVASIATSIGILGTFVGVFISLIHFNEKDIAGSVPGLLEGLKTAFITSIVGLIVSLIVKAFPHKLGESAVSREEHNRDGMINNMIYYLREIQAGICGDNGNSILSHTKQLREENTQQLTQIDNSIREFGEKVVADSTQSLIDALTQVMRDFNTKINEQFGENFKRLNDGVGKMLEWQQEYYQQITYINSQFKSSLTAIEKCESVLQKLTNQANVYHDSAEKLDYLLYNLNLTLTGLDETARNAKETFPLIDKNIKELTTHFSGAIESALRENNRMMESQRGAIDSQINTFQKSYQDIGQQQHKLVSELSGRIEKLMLDSSEIMKKQMATLDKELGEELNKALESLGKQLSSLSSKFVEDYGPLTDKLRILVQSANRIN